MNRVLLVGIVCHIEGENFILYVDGDYFFCKGHSPELYREAIVAGQLKSVVKTIGLHKYVTYYVEEN